MKEVKNKIPVCEGAYCAYRATMNHNGIKYCQACYDKVRQDEAAKELAKSILVEKPVEVVV